MLLGHNTYASAANHEHQKMRSDTSSLDSPWPIVPDGWSVYLVSGPGPSRDVGVPVEARRHSGAGRIASIGPIKLKSPDVLANQVSSSARRQIRTRLPWHLI